MKRISFITLCLSALLSSCSADWHLRKAISKDPSILIEPKSITLIDTIVTTQLRVDTVLNTLHDTAFLVNDILRVQYKKINDTIRITGECLTDTVIIEREVELPAQIVYKEKDNYWQNILNRLFLILAVFAVGRYLLDRYLNR